MKKKKYERLWTHRRPDYKMGSRATPYDSTDSRISEKSFVKRERNKKRNRQAWYYQTKRIPRERKISTLPVWFWPIVVLFILLLLIFLIIPEVVDRSAGHRQQIAETNDSSFDALYDDQVQVVNESFVTLYEEPDIGSERITQVLFNSPVLLLDEPSEESEFVNVELLNGLTGYLPVSSLTKDRQSVEANLYKMKVIVTDVNKRVMTHAINGNLLIEVKRGTLLYVTYRGPDIYKVQLTDGREGWISSDGVIALPSGAVPPLTNANQFANSVRAYRQAKWLDAGRTNEGIDMYGVMYLTAYINGLELPVEEEAFWESGDTVSDAIDTGCILFDKLTPGDVVFYERLVNRGADGVVETDPSRRLIGVWLGDGKLLTESIHTFSIVEVDAKWPERDWAAVRVARYFPTAE